MINLLPPDIKQDIHYARLNSVMRRWIVNCVLALVGIGVIVAGGLLFMQKSISDNTKQIAQARQQLQDQKVDETQKQLESISANTKLVVQVLSKEVLFSKLLRQIGSALPANTALKGLQIDSVQGGVQLNAAAKDFNAGTQLQVNLQDPKNGVFEKADINSITCGAVEGQQQTGPFPCDVNVRALFNKNNSYLYIAPNAGSTKQ